MENFVFPDGNKTKLIKMYELMNMFPILTGIQQKGLQKVVFIYTGKKSKRPLCFGLPLEGKYINRKKLNMWTFNFYLLRVQTKVGCYGLFRRASIKYQRCRRTRYLKSHGL